MTGVDAAGGPGYRVVEQADLRRRNTFGLAAHAARLVEVDALHALPGLLASPWLRDADLLPLGGGSNLLFAADPAGVVLSIRAHDMAIVDDRDPTQVVFRAEAGVDWHGCVSRSLELGLAGLENLALIPGTVGAAPIQNIGAYGVELDSRVHAVEAWDRERQRPVRLSRSDCAFGYRDSIFKREPARWLVTAVEFALSRVPALVLDYAGLREELAAHAVDAPTPLDVAEAVCRLRRRKLPDPDRIGNAGSFFKNPVVPAAHAAALCAGHPGLPVFGAVDDRSRKLSAAWLIDACGWKGHRDGDAGVSATHALVLVNHGGASGADLLALARRIAASVSARFDVALQPEPRIVGASW